MNYQNLHWPGIRDAVRKEVKNDDTCQRTKWSNIKYGKLPAKESEEIPREKICVYIIYPYVIRRKGQKENLILKDVTMLDPVTRRLEITQYDDKISISIVKLV